MAKLMIIVLGMVLLSCLTVYASPGAFTPDECCFHFVNGRLRKINVANYRRTSSHCSKPGIILTMMNDDEFCVHPNLQWVQNVTAFVDQRK
ncbi:chemokine (C-C motif) ligand 38, duplicate 6 [Periophthalmus magnuspinnatus]|uniref:chemokine (C-C motif) ligand 38, duplicate 6 n=1 Tax=Periophthalmus magnuspinnatus TaxID=409849 RepID=UPI00145BC6FA|nr:chemokine (C-C motif) ligand 38, duplicate 6 [Periophthalmus magnuspinnatus]